MIYEIRKNSDFITGASLHVMIPNEDLDKKALHTIERDWPDFILPFHYRHIDGQIEFIYQIGSRSKLQYLSGQRSPNEYAGIWSGILDPLRTCGDWFMRPYSFVLMAEHLYCEKNTNKITYLYIPSVRACSGKSELKEMAADITRLVAVTDPELENMALRLIIKDFDPDDFMQMLELYIAAADPDLQPGASSGPAHAGASDTDADCNSAAPAFPDPEPDPDWLPGATALPALGLVSGPSGGQDRIRRGKEDGSRDIVINIPSSGQPAKKAGKGLKTKENPPAKTEGKPVDWEKAGGLFGRKKNARQRDPAETGSIRETPVEYQLPAAPIIPLNHESFEPPDENDTTQNLSTAPCASGFRLVGNTVLPPFISVSIGQGEVFTVGRYDAATGRQLSDFEFERKTKAVSRRHAAVERDESGYSIVDLASSAGTFVDGKRLLPNTPCQLGANSRISFGNAGADYVWEG